MTTHTTTIDASTSRQTWMDLARGGAVILVVFFHATTVLDGHEVPNQLRWVNSAVGAYRMPLLMVMSGILLSRSLNKPPGEYMIGKIRTLLWPLALWGAISGAIVTTASAWNPAWWINGDASHTWFLAVLFLCYSLALAARRVPPVYLSVTMLVIAMILRESNSEVLLFGAKLFWFGGFFFAGAAITPHFHRLKQTPWWIVAGGMAIAGVGAILSVKAGAHFAFNVRGAIFSLVGIFVLLWVLPRVPRLAPVRWVEWIGRHSIVTYLVHWPVMLLGGRLLGQFGGWMGFVGVFFSALAVCILATWLKPYTSWLYAFPRFRSQRI